MQARAGLEESVGFGQTEGERRGTAALCVRNSRETQPLALGFITSSLSLGHTATGMTPGVHALPSLATSLGEQRAGLCPGLGTHLPGLPPPVGLPSPNTSCLGLSARDSQLSCLCFPSYVSLTALPAPAEPGKLLPQCS